MHLVLYLTGAETSKGVITVFIVTDFLSTEGHVMRLKALRRPGDLPRSYNFSPYS
jgi:hypothetical protein